LEFDTVSPLEVVHPLASTNARRCHESIAYTALSLTDID
jgi:hypothetical protein